MSKSGFLSSRKSMDKSREFNSSRCCGGKVDEESGKSSSAVYNLGVEGAGISRIFSFYPYKLVSTLFIICLYHFTQLIKSSIKSAFAPSVLNPNQNTYQPHYSISTTFHFIPLSWQYSIISANINLSKESRSIIYFLHTKGQSDHYAVTCGIKNYLKRRVNMSTYRLEYHNNVALQEKIKEEKINKNNNNKRIHNCYFQSISWWLWKSSGCSVWWHDMWIQTWPLFWYLKKKRKVVLNISFHRL